MKPESNHVNKTKYDRTYRNNMKLKGFRRVQLWLKESFIDRTKEFVEKLNREEK